MKPIVQKAKKHIYRGTWFAKNMKKFMDGFQFGRGWKQSGEGRTLIHEGDNPLRTFFNTHSGGRGIMKWEHYLDVYHRHLKKFVGKEVHIVEIGVHSGGSIAMWKEFFGPNCKVYGIDIDEVSKQYEDEQTKIFIGDQGDRDFWKKFKEQVPRVDILIDDGSHNAEHQIVTLEEMVPHMQPGGVFICEDVKRYLNAFSLYMLGMTLNLSGMEKSKGGKKKEEQKCLVNATGFQKYVDSIHYYPYMVVMEKMNKTRETLVATKRGDEWRHNKAV